VIPRLRIEEMRQLRVRFVARFERSSMLAERDMARSLRAHRLAALEDLTHGGTRRAIRLRLVAEYRRRTSLEHAREASRELAAARSWAEHIADYEREWLPGSDSSPVSDGARAA